CRSVITLLLSVGFVSEHCTISGRCQYQLGRSADNLSLAEILKTMADAGEEALYLHPHPQTLIALETCSQVEKLVASSLGGETLKDLVERSQAQSLVENGGQ
ncbi:MAG: hypothetical protein KAU22_02055, partial [Desulfuromonadales bacterium]|nr:hypothetical protein [Desulfuromonadales bacterium]